ncbi:MAG: M48 family metallopeptidase [Oscillospiraceae bacterium]|nr:M48 family metallopeptidase [Oscillospiraceae bacterium]
MEYRLIRSRRKTLTISIEDGGVTVRAPNRLSRRTVDVILKEKGPWVERCLAISRERKAARDAFSLTYGDSVSVLGRDVPIVPSDGWAARYDGDRISLPPGLTPRQIIAECVGIYKEVAKAAFTEKAALYARTLGVAPAALKVSDASKRWGSCSSKGVVSFSWMLAMADEDLADYVIVHELAHLKEMNHSARFWAEVDKVVEDRKRKSACLTALQARMESESWEA